MKVSVIIPIFNTEKYLKKCVQSVLEQTYKDLEIILIDDGSIDRSAQICDDFFKNDSRIIVIHKENGGLSSARNKGMKLATGKYITFLDSDDFLANDFIFNTVNACEKYNADIAIMKMCYISENTNVAIRDFDPLYEKQFNAQTAIQESLYQVLYSCCAPGKLYKNSVLNGIEFPLGRLSEDLSVCHKIFNNAKRIIYTSKSGYYYRQHTSSIMHTFNPQRLDALQWTKEIEDFCRIKYPAIENAAICRTFNVAIHLLLDLPNFGETHDKFIDEIWHEIKRTRVNVLLDKNVRFRDKAAALLSYGGEFIIKKIWNSKFAIRQVER